MSAWALRLRVWYRVEGLGLGFEGIGLFEVRDSGYRSKGLGSGFGMQGLGLRVWATGRIDGFGHRV